MTGTKTIVFLLVITVNIVLGETEEEVEVQEPCGIPADIAILIDSSRSIKSEDYLKQIEFVQEMVSMFEVGPEATHVAALTFAAKTAVEFYFGQYETSEEAKERIGNIKHANGAATYTHDAIRTMREDIFTVEHGMRPEVPKIGILLTDGRSTSAYRTQKEANITKALGIKLLAIGIGNINKYELQTLVTPPHEDNFFYRADFDDLKSDVLKKMIAQKACKALETKTNILTPIPKTTTPAIATTIAQTNTSPTTETTSRGEPTTTTIKTTQNVATEPEGVRTTSSISKELPTSTAASTSSTTLSTTSTMGTTSTTEVKTTVKKPEPEVNTATFTTTTTTSSSAYTTSTKMPNREHGKKPQGDQPRCDPLVQADIMFGLQAIGGGDRENVAIFIKALASGLDLNSGSFKLGLKENCKENVLYPTEFIYFDDYTYAVNDVMETDIAPILFHTRRAFNLSKRRVARVAILLISGKINDMQRVQRIAESMKRNTKIIVIGVGKFFDTKQLQDLASYRDSSVPDISHVFPVTDSTSLVHIVKKVKKLLCN